MNDVSGVRAWLLAAVALVFALPLTPLADHAGTRSVVPEWTSVGPAPLRIPPRLQPGEGPGPNSGQVTGIALDPRGGRDRVIHVATNDGGIWTSGDGGGTWRPATDAMPALSMGAVALDPGDPATVYAGTGNPSDPGLTFSRGVGIYRSSDAGATWTQLGADLFRGALISAIATPGPRSLLVATSHGLYRSVDGGASFGSDPPGFRNGQPVVRSSALAVRLDTADPATVYASFFGLGLLRSTDGGATFPTTLLPSREGVILAQSTQPDARTIYVSAGDTEQSYRLLRSTDRGASFEAMPAAENGVRNGPAHDDGGCSCVLNRTIGVDPQDSRRVYIGFRELYVSVDGGASFANVSRGKIHFDHHALVFSPRSHWEASPTRLYVGTDGGIATSADGGATFRSLNEGLATSLLYGADFGRGGRDANGRIYAGAQDTGVDVRRPADAGRAWETAVTGDGGPAAADPNDPDRAYSSQVGISPAQVLVTSDGGESWAVLGAAAGRSGAGAPAPADPDDAGTADPPDAAPADPADPGPVHSFPRIAVDAGSGSPGHPSGTVYVADSTRLLQAVDAGAESAAQIHLTPIRTFASPITALAVRDQVAYVGLTNGSVWRTSAARSGAAAAWAQVPIAAAPSLPVGALAIDSADPDRVAVGYFSAGVGTPNPAQHVFLSGDGGSTWVDASAGLPDLTVNAVVLDAGMGPDRPHTVVVATAAGVMRSVADGRDWAPLGRGLPPVDVTSLAFDPATRTLLAGTYGRGAYEVVLPAPPPPDPPLPPRTGWTAPLAPVAGGAVAAGAGAAIVLLARARRRARGVGGRRGA